MDAINRGVHRHYTNVLLGLRSGILGSDQKEILEDSVLVDDAEIVVMCNRWGSFLVGTKSCSPSVGYLWQNVWNLCCNVRKTMIFFLTQM